MKTKYLLVSLVLGLGLALGLLGVLGSRHASAGTGSNATLNTPAAERQVCATCAYTTIQAAVDDAAPGDVIKVAEGTYSGVHARNGVTQVVYISKSVIIRGGYTAPGFTDPPDPDAHPVVLDAGGQGRVIYITGNINPIIDGLRITGGDATGQGGWWTDVGGGVYVITATATISNSWIYSNTSSGFGNGGGLCLYRSDATVVNNDIYSNTAGSCGAGVFIAECSAATLSGNMIHYNNSVYDGGGVCSEDGSATLRGNVIANNNAPDYGGGMFTYHAIDTLINNVVIDNYAGKGGSGLYIDTSSYRLLHTTIARNGGGDGSGVAVVDDGGGSHSFVVMTNTVLVSQTVGVTATALNTAVARGVLWFGNGGNTGGAGFVSSMVDYTGDPAFAADGYHLTASSYAIDRGISSSVTDDIDGETRNIPDLGADEYAVAPNVFEVCPSGCAYSTIQAAVDAAICGDIIKVAAGTYADIHQREGITQMVYITKGVTIRGGYAAPGFADPPNPDANPTILDAGGQGRVVYIAGYTNPTLEGLRITGGDATGLGGGPWSYDGAGGGIYVVTATATIRDCAIYDNVAGSNDWSGGGGIYLFRSPSSLVDNAIYSNTAGVSAGGGLRGEGGGLAISGGDPTLTGNVIEGNVAAGTGEGLGGGVYMEVSDAVLRNNIVRNNGASGITYGQGGGIYIFDATPTLINTVLLGNFSGTTTDSWGGGLALEDADPQLLHTTFVNNSGGAGNAVFARDGSNAAMTNTVVVDHATAGISVTGSSSAMVNGVLWFANGVNTSGAGAVTVTNAYTGMPAFDLDGYHLTAGSPAVDRGVNAGVTEDIDGQARNIPDLGADEWLPQVTVDSNVGGTIVYTDPWGLTTTIEIPPGAVAQSTTIVFSPLFTPTYPLPPGMLFAGHAFDLDVACESRYLIYLPLVMRSHTVRATGLARVYAIQPGLAVGQSDTCASSSPLSVPCSPTLQKPVTITIYYRDADVAGLDENTLTLYRWTGTYWEDSIDTCTPASTYVRNTTGNMLQVTVCHLSRWGMVGR